MQLLYLFNFMRVDKPIYQKFAYQNYPPGTHNAESEPSPLPNLPVERNQLHPPMTQIVTYPKISLTRMLLTGNVLRVTFATKSAK